MIENRQIERSNNKMNSENKKAYLPYEIEFAEEFDEFLGHVLCIRTDSSDEDIIRMIHQIVDETELKVLTESWHSRFNTYVTYKDKPFLNEGFIYQLAFEYDKQTENKFGFAKSILAKWISKVNQFNKLLVLTSK